MVHAKDYQFICRCARLQCLLDQFSTVSHLAMRSVTEARRESTARWTHEGGSHACTEADVREGSRQQTDEEEMGTMAKGGKSPREERLVASGRAWNGQINGDGL